MGEAIYHEAGEGAHGRKFESVYSLATLDMLAAGGHADGIWEAWPPTYPLIYYLGVSCARNGRYSYFTRSLL